MIEGPRFPFSAVVGQDAPKLALLLNAIDPSVGGVLLRGQKGSAKSTIARGLAALLPGRAPFVELPVGATEDRLVGTLDLASALTSGEFRFRSGLLADADGGLLYVDEVNLLPDHLVDALLDVAASGVNRVEREGVSHVHPSRFVLVGSMNPEEGELRPQFLDRFGLAVDVIASTDPDERAEAVTRRLSFDADPDVFGEVWEDAERSVAEGLASRRPAELPAGLRRSVSVLCASVGAEGLRADLVICRAAAALAGWEGRSEADASDVRRVAPMALAHRGRRNPLDDHGIDSDALDRALDQALGERPEGDRPEGDSAEGESDGVDSGDHVVAPDSAAPVVRLEATRPAPDPSRWPGEPPSGRRSVQEGRRGRLIGDRGPGPEGASSVAIAATVRAAVTRRAGGSAGNATSLVAPGDLREAVREQRVGNLVILVVDASGSMGAAQRMEAAKGAVLSLLLDAYERRDRVALVTFRDDQASVVLRPTGSIEVARARLTELPTGGRTPLAAGIEAALTVAGRAAATADGVAHRPLLVLVTDGRATTASGDSDPVEAAQEAAAVVRRRGISAVVIDAEDGATRLGLARRLAEAMDARYLTVPELSAPSVVRAIRQAQGG